MGRPPCCDKANVKRGLWTPEEDAKILAYVSSHGTGNWTQVPKKAGLNRCGKSCRLRWTNYLRPDLKHEEFTEKEEELIIQYHAAIGSRWSLIAKQLPGRTDNDVKNYWNTKLKKKLSKLGIDPITHKPYTKIFSDFRSISCLTTINQPTFLDNKSSVTDLSSIQSGIQNLNIGGIHLKNQFPSIYSYSDNCSLQQEAFSHYMDELSPTSSSSSSSSSISNSQSGSCLLSFTQPLQTTDVNEEEHNVQGFLATDLPTQNQENNDQFAPAVLNIDTATGETETTEASNHYEPSSVSSFVKTLLDRDSEMQSSFPVFEDILDY